MRDHAADQKEYYVFVRARAYNKSCGSVVTARTSTANNKVTVVVLGLNCTAKMDKGAPTEYTSVPPTAYPPTTVDIDGYQPAAPSHPQVTSQPPPPAYVPPSKPTISVWCSRCVR